LADDHDIGGRSTIPRIVIIGIGNEDRGDDGIGLIAARKIRRIFGDKIRVFENSGDGAAMLEQWRGAELVIVIDAAYSGAKTGLIRKFMAGEQPLPTTDFPKNSTHNFGLYEAVETARALGTLPRRLIVYGIEGGCFSPGATISSAVLEAVELLIEEICCLMREEGIRHNNESAH